HGENSTVIQYEARSVNSLPNDMRLEVYPLIAFRDYHSLTRENGALNSQVAVEDGLATVRPYDGLPALHLAHNATEIADTGYWYPDFEYRVERERGLDFKEDLFNPCVMKFDLGQQSQATIIASTERRDIAMVADRRQAEIARRAGIVASLPCENELV